MGRRGWVGSGGTDGGELPSQYDCFADPDAAAFFADMGHEPPERSQGTWLPDLEAIACVLDESRSLSFPRSSGGTASFTSLLRFLPKPRRRTAATRY
ncbi:MAG TPA: hypothetical protein VER33_24750 [Polyangiaceae bacterium]|nr:hypothetical protein [Polyangiaceae bacterium]